MSEKGTRLLKVFKALEAHPIIGISNKEISDGLGISPVHVSRDLDDLIAEGLVVKLDNGNFAYSVKTLQIAERFWRQHEQLQAEQVKQRFQQRGETIKDWCDQRGYDPTYVSRILNGSVKANRGKANCIAVELGLKKKVA